MRTRQIIVDSTLGEHNAKLLVCDCGNEIFRVFTVQGHDHEHYQCVDCDDTYCRKGALCEEVPTIERSSNH